jgi:hypothetical protein
MAANIHRHPAPNRALGELLPGWFDIPQNPITARSQGINYTPTLGEIMAGSFTIPENPIVNFASGNVLPLGVNPAKAGVVNGQPVGTGMSGGCGCGGSCGGCGGGMGDISADLTTFSTDLMAGNFQTALFTDTIAGFPAWSVLAVTGGLLWYFLAPTGKSRVGKAYHKVRRKAAAAYAA